MISIRLLTKKIIHPRFWNHQDFHCWIRLTFLISTRSANLGNHFRSVKLKAKTTFQDRFHASISKLIYHEKLKKSAQGRKCDFINDCEDGSDEEDCNISCPVYLKVNVLMDESGPISGTYTQTNETVNGRPVWRREGRQQWLYYSTERLKWLFSSIQDGISSTLHSFDGDIVCPHLSAGWIFSNKNNRRYSLGSYEMELLNGMKLSRAYPYESLLKSDWSPNWTISNSIRTKKCSYVAIDTTFSLCIQGWEKFLLWRKFLVASK